MEAGGNYASQIVAAIRKCDIFVMLASESTNVSGHVSNEVSIAFDNKKILYRLRFRMYDLQMNICIFWEESIGSRQVVILMKA